MSIADLQSAIAKAEERVADLEKKRGDLLAHLDAVNAEILALTGPSAPAPKTKEPEPKPKRRGRPKGRGMKAGSLPLVIADVLKASDKPMSAPEIGEAVLKTGYKTRAKDVTKVVREALRRVPGFKKVSRGMYTVK